MRKALTNYRYYVLTAIWLVGLLALLAIPSDALATGLWFTLLIVTKLAGLVILYAGIVLYVYWRNQEAIETPDEIVKDLLKIK